MQANHTGVSLQGSSVPGIDWPMVSVVMPATRFALAGHALQALSQQSYGGKLEIIVVGLFADLLAQHWSILPVNPGRVHTPGAARNLGARSAHGSVLLFLDDDMLVGRHWVEQNVRELQRYAVGLVGARMPGVSPGFFARCVDFTNYGYYQHRRCVDQPLGAGSMCVEQHLFHSVGGFDERLLSSEDIDLSYRVQKSGYRTIYQPAIVVLHNHLRDTFGKLLRYNYRHGLASGLTIKVRYSGHYRQRYLFFCMRVPWLFLLLLPLVVTIATAKILLLNFCDHRSVLFYLPFIWLGKLAFYTGVFLHLLQHSTEVRLKGHAYVANNFG